MTLLADARTGLRAGTTSTSHRALNYLPGTAFVFDVVLIALVGGVAIAGRDALGALGAEDSISETLGVAGPLMVVGWIAAVAVLGGYQRDVFGAGADEYKRVARAGGLTAAATGIGCYLANFDLSRGFFMLLFVVGIPTLLMGRYVLRCALHRAHRAGFLLSRVVISGSPDHVDEIAQVLRRDSWLGYQVVGALTPTYDRADLTPGGIAVVGHSEHVQAAIHDLAPDIVFFADNSLGSGTQMRKVVWDLEDQAVQVVVAPSLADISHERVKIRPVGGLPLIHVSKPGALQATRWAKRTFDVVGSLALIIAFSPVLLFAMLRIRAHDYGPALFSQTRIGRDGSSFQCLKFRTMVTNAEVLLAELKAASGHEDVLFKMRDDPRVTRPGRWLRRYSLDELPQLFNVLRGDMSLIGPRPGLPCEAEQYSSDVIRRLRVRPGMTGLWQVSGRSDLSFEEAVRLDLYYVDNWSMLQDLTILMRTFGAVFGSRGAY